MKKLIHRILLLLLFSFIAACQSNKQEQLVTWGYITGDPILDAGHEGNFYPQVIRENEGAISQ
jgi:hypothetical protein